MIEGVLEFSPQRVQVIHQRHGAIDLPVDLLDGGLGPDLIAEIDTRHVPGRIVHLLVGGLIECSPHLLLLG